MGWIKEIINSISIKNEVKQRNPSFTKDNSKIGWNIYLSPNTTRAEYVKKFQKVHGRFKYKLIVPILIIARRFFLPKYQHENAVPVCAYNREWVVYEKAFNLAMVDMAWKLQHESTMDKGLKFKDVQKKLVNEPKYFLHLKTVKQAPIYLPMMDTAYHEFGAFLMHRIVEQMNKEFSGKKYNRVIYDSKAINDFHWFIAQKVINPEFNKSEVTLKEIMEEEYGPK